MPIADVYLVFQWWMTLLLVGVAAYPLTKKLFSSWFDNGYLLSKAVGMATTTYLVFLLGTLHILSFTLPSIIISVCIVFIGGLLLNAKCQMPNAKLNTKLGNSTFIYHLSFIIGHFRKNGQKQIVLIVIEELFFFVALLIWSWVKAHEPSIQSLEKFMDYGFMQSLLNSSFFPAPDMWWAGGTINYYFFGHLVTAVLTRLSGLDLSVTFNLMLATLFALTFTMSFGIGVQLFRIKRYGAVDTDTKHEARSTKSETMVKAVNSKVQNFRNLNFGFISNFDIRISDLFSGMLTAFLVTLAGNMQTIYAFTKGYVGDPPPGGLPFWNLFWGLKDIGGIGGLWDGTLLGKLGEGMNRYWYANATRFIPFTIHEFPSYSFVVSDVHGHVLSIPFVLLAIGLLITLFGQNVHDRKNDKFQMTNDKLNLKFQISKLKTNISELATCNLQLLFFGFLLGVLLMTNALDGPIYGLLFVALFLTTNKSQIPNPKSQTNFKFPSRFAQGEQISNFKLWGNACIPIVSVIGITILTALPFLVHFTSFASGIGVNCPPAFLANTKIGPFLFEGVEKCQKSPLWMMALLWGFFWYTGAWLFFRRMWGKEHYDSPVSRILKVFYVFGIFLIIIPEFFYVKDIYPAHFRSNTMFKLGYEAFILWSIVAGYVITNLIQRRSQRSEVRKSDIRPLRFLFFLLLLPQLFFVSIYPIFSTRSYFGELKTYRGLDGLEWLRREYPDDYEAIVWLRNQTQNSKLKSQNFSIVEADGESYTNYNHVSAFSGVPTIVGWAVHEWLWRGGYDEVGPRRDEVRAIYTHTDVEAIRSILSKYHVRYIIVGPLEREKYPDLSLERLAVLGTLVFQSGETRVYEVGNLPLDK